MQESTVAMLAADTNKTIIVIHAGSKADFACPQKGFYIRVMKLRSRQGKPRRLEGGSLMHRLLEVYYQLKMWSDFPHDFIVDEAIKFGRYCIVAEEMSNLAQPEAEHIIQKFKEYAEYYINDTWKPIMVEQPFAKTIYEDESYHIIGESQIDLAAMDTAENGVPGLFVADHKTEEKHSVPDKLQDQGYMYAWWSEQPFVISNRIGLQEKKKDPFHREVLTYEEDQVQEWVQEIAEWAINTDRQLKSGYHPRQFAICHQYGKCTFADICAASESERERIINRDFFIGEDRDHFENAP